MYVMGIYRGGQFYWSMNSEKTTDLPQVIGNRYHIMLYQVHLAMSQKRQKINVAP
jgi:hypothetical protein